MSAGRREASGAVRLSVHVYRRLLVAYPRPFRHQYGGHMVQVFRDCSYDAGETGGAAGLARYWLIALGDLVLSAFSERQQEEFPMSRALWIRIGSLAAIVASVTALLLDIPTIRATAQLLSAARTAGPPIAAWGPIMADDYLQREAWEATPVIWLLVVLALIGLAALGARRLGVLGQIGIAAGVSGAALIGIGDAMVAAVARDNGMCFPLYCPGFDRQNHAAMGQTAVLVGALLLASGMIAYGVAAVRGRLLSQGLVNALPFIVGLLALASSRTYLPRVVSVSYLELYQGVPFIRFSHDGARTVILVATVNLALAIALALLGRLLWLRQHVEPAAPAQQPHLAAG